ncbi:hypothetical protein LTR85_011651 [Meristemomyces frigidus]|nr:hypothetical protein LTR85_011651 [Meristemomyces frigidus]
MGGHLKHTVITVLYPIAELNNRGWTRDKLEKWIPAAHGRHAAKFIEGETTHLVCSEKTWKDQPVQIQAALAANAKASPNSNGKGAVWIMKPDWLMTAIDEQRHPREGSHSWEKLEREAMTLTSRADKAAEKAAAKEAQGPRTVQGLLTETLMENADKFISEEDRREMEKEIRKRKEEAAREAQEKEREKKREREQAALFRKGAKKAKNEVFSENHHIYMDSTGFKYEVLITKVDTKHNRNERHALTLQIYESNSHPHTYALNLHFAGTGLLPSNNVIAAIGCSFHTAFHAFKKCFRDKTKIHWDDRIAFAVERAKREKRQRGSPDGTRRGRAVSEASLLEEGLRAMDEVEFAKRPFVYHPPLYGPRGLLPEKQREVFPEIGPPLVQEGRDWGVEEIELWMSGANGVGPSPNAAVAEAGAQADGGEFVNGLTPAVTQGGESNAVSDFDQFMSGGLAGAGGASALAMNDGGHDSTFDFGETSYPFGDNGDEFDFGLGGADGKGSPVGYAQDTRGNDQQVQETMLGHTQLAEDARAQLEELMGDVPAPRDSTEAETVTAGHGRPLNLNSSVLGKRKTSPVEGAGAAKKRSPERNDEFVDAAESFSGEAYALDSTERVMGGMTPRDTEEMGA